MNTLKTFQMIVNHGSFNRAAEEMNYAQSTVTMQIKKLEAELGHQLIERGKKKIRLTEAGRLFYEKSLGIVRNMEQLQTDLSGMLVGEVGNVRLGVMEPTASYRLPEILKGFLSRFPNIRISLEVANTPFLSDKLLDGDLDMAICSTPNLRTDLYFEQLFREEYVLLLPEKHPLAEKAVIAHTDLKGHRLLVTGATCPYQETHEDVLEETREHELDTMEIGSVTALKYYVEKGLGIALVPKIVLNTDSPLDGTVTRAFNSPLRMTTGLLCKTSEYPFKSANLELYQYLKEKLLEEN